MPSVDARARLGSDDKMEAENLRVCNLRSRELSDQCGMITSLICLKSNKIISEYRLEVQCQFAANTKRQSEPIMDLTLKMGSAKLVQRPSIINGEKSFKKLTWPAVGLFNACIQLAVVAVSSRSTQLLDV